MAPGIGLTHAGICFTAPGWATLGCMTFAATFGLLVWLAAAVAGALGDGLDDALADALGSARRARSARSTAAARLAMSACV
jgi:hypothetical protein